MQHCEFFNLNGFSFYVSDTQFHFMCTLYSTDITSQDKNLYIFPVLLMCLPYKLNITNLSTNQRGCRLQTSPECYSMSDTCNLNIKLKKQTKRKSPLIHLLYAEMHHSVYQTYKYSQVNGQYSNNKNTQTRHYTVQYAA